MKQRIINNNTGVMAIDFGTRNVGFAVGNLSTKIAVRLPYLKYKKGTMLFKTIDDYVSKYQVTEVLVGVPLGLSGSPTKQSVEVEAFLTELENRGTFKITRWNETGTTHMAENKLGSKDSQTHSEAARIMLQEYFDFLESGV